LIKEEFEVAKFLIKRDCKLGVVNKNGETAISLCKNDEIKQLIVEKIRNTVKKCTDKRSLDENLSDFILKKPKIQHTIAKMLCQYEELAKTIDEVETLNEEISSPKPAMVFSSSSPERSHNYSQSEELLKRGVIRIGHNLPDSDSDSKSDNEDCKTSSNQRMSV
jgi:hypothetical protein